MDTKTNTKTNGVYCGEGLTIHFATIGNVPGKLADAELHFDGGPLNGLKLAGFAVWERSGGRQLNVTFPSRNYQINGERRTYALLRPTGDATGQEPLRRRIINAYLSQETGSEQRYDAPTNALGSGA